MNWPKVLAQDELPNGERCVVEAGGRAVLPIHHGTQVCAVDRVCRDAHAAKDGPRDDRPASSKASSRRWETKVEIGLT